jgi:hypothetical protein
MGRTVDPVGDHVPGPRVASIVEGLPHAGHEGPRFARVRSRRQNVVLAVTGRTPCGNAREAADAGQSARALRRQRFRTEHPASQAQARLRRAARGQVARRGMGTGGRRATGTRGGARAAEAAAGHRIAAAAGLSGGGAGRLEEHDTGANADSMRARRCARLVAGPGSGGGGAGPKRWGNGRKRQWPPRGGGNGRRGAGAFRRRGALRSAQRRGRVREKGDAFEPRMVRSA